MLGRLDEAAQSFALAVATKERSLGRDHPDVAISLSNLGWTLTLIGRYDEAEAALSRAQEIHRRSLPDDNALQAALVTNLGDLAVARGRHQEAERHYRQAILQFEKTVGADPPSLPLPLTGLGRALLAQGRFEEAQAQLGRALRLQLAHPGDAVELADTRAVLARVLVAAGGDGARAEELLGQALDGYRSAGPRGRRGLDELTAWRADRGTIKDAPRTGSGP